MNQDNHTTQMPICVACKKQMHFHGLQTFPAKYNLPDMHYCECNTVGCKFGIPVELYGEWVRIGKPANDKPKGSTYTVEGYYECVIGLGYTDEQYQAAQALLGGE